MMKLILFTLCFFTLRSYCCSLVVQSYAEIKRDLVGEGFKRDLKTNVQLKSTLDLGNCEILIKEVIPSGAYIDPNEISLYTKKEYLNIYIPQMVDVETPEYLSPKLQAYVFSQLTDTGRNIYMANISTPIHLRYHRPKSGMYEALEDHIEFPNPSIFISCDDEDKLEYCHAYNHLQPCSSSHKEQCDWIHIHSYSDKKLLEASVPVGNSDLVETVLFTTAAISFCSVALILVNLFKPNKEKTT